MTWNQVEGSRDIPYDTDTKYWQPMYGNENVFFSLFVEFGVIKILISK